MGKTMPYTSPDGAQHPDAFWCLQKLHAEIDDSMMRLQFIGYHDAASYDADRDPISGAVKEYMLAGDGFQQAINLATAHPQGTPISVEILRMAWQVVLAAKEIGEPPADGQPDTRTSFFETATAVAT